MTLTAAQIAQFSLGALLIVLLPGPNSLFVMTTAARVGARAGFRASGGVVIGDGVLMVAAALGAGALLSGGNVVFRVLCVVGGLYLAWLALGLLRRGAELWGARSDTELAEPTAQTMSDATRSPFRRSLATSLLNPKAILFFAAFFVQFIKPGDPHLWENFAVLALIMEAISFAYLSTVIIVASRVGHRLSGRPKAVSAAHVAAGAAFLMFAVKLGSAALAS